MSHYWAVFQKESNHLFRFDTRIYINPRSYPLPDDYCIGAIVGKNPGSAQPESVHSENMQAIKLAGDNLLPTVKTIVTKAYISSGKSVPKTGYIQVLNLFYLCNPDLNTAISNFKKSGVQQFCDSESKEFPFIWYVWGNHQKNLNEYKLRFLSIRSPHHFYVSKHTQEIIKEAPGPLSFAKHTQGMKQQAVISHLKKIIS